MTYNKWESLIEETDYMREFNSEAEYERINGSEKLLQEYREALKKALGYTQELSSIYTDTECVQIKSEIDSFYKKAKSLIEPKTDKT